jgi:hypothetical protein
MFFPDKRQQDLLDEQQTKDQLMQADNKLMDDLNTFNTKYARYVKCNVNKNQLCTPGGTCPAFFSDCGVGEPKVADLKSLEIVINDDLRAIKRITTRNSGSLISPEEYVSSYETIKKREADNIKLRREIDLKLREVYNIDGPTLEDGVLPYDASMYSAMLFTILATTGLFYAFTKL